MTYPQSLPEIGLLKLSEVLKIMSISKSPWYEGVKNGDYPRPIKIGKRAARWDINDIRNLIAQRKAQS